MRVLEEDEFNYVCFCEPLGSSLVIKPPNGIHQIFFIPHRKRDSIDDLPKLVEALYSLLKESGLEEPVCNLELYFLYYLVHRFSGSGVQEMFQNYRCSIQHLFFYFSDFLVT